MANRVGFFGGVAQAGRQVAQAFNRVGHPRAERVDRVRDNRVAAQAPIRNDRAAEALAGRVEVPEIQPGPAQEGQQPIREGEAIPPALQQPPNAQQPQNPQPGAERQQIADGHVLEADENEAPQRDVGQQVVDGLVDLFHRLAPRARDRANAVVQGQPPQLPRARGNAPGLLQRILGNHVEGLAALPGLLNEIQQFNQHPQEMGRNLNIAAGQVVNPPPRELQDLSASLRRLQDGEILDEAAFVAIHAELTRLLDFVRDRPPLPNALQQNRDAALAAREQFYRDHAFLFFALRNRHNIQLPPERIEIGFIQMGQLQDFVRPDQGPRRAERQDEFRQLVQDVFQFIDCVVFTNTGAAVAAIAPIQDAVVAGVERLRVEVEHLRGVVRGEVDHAIGQAVLIPRLVVEDIVGPIAAAPAAAEPPAGAPPQPPANQAAPGGLPENWRLGDLVNHLGGWLRDGIQGYASGLVIDTFISSLEQAAVEANEPIQGQIRAVVEQIRTARRDNQLPGLIEIIRRISNGQAILDNAEAGNRILQFVFMGFRIPILQGVNVAPVDEGFRRVMNRLPPLPQDPINYQAALPQAKTRLVDNIGALSIMERINRWFCSSKITTGEIPILLSAAHRGVFKDEIQKLFFAKIDAMDINLIRKWMAKFSYVAMRFFSESFMTKLSDGFLKKMEEFIQAQQNNGIAAPMRNFQTSSINNLNNYLTILHDRITRLGNNPAYARSEVMIENALSDPSANEGFTKSKLYSTAIGKAIDDFLPPIGWKARFDVWNKNHNPALKVFLKVLGGWPIGIMESISSGIARFILKLFLTKSKAFDKMIDLSVQVRDRNGYTHAINKMSLSLLQKIYEQLNHPAGMGNRGEPIANREALTQMIVNFHNVLLLNAQAGRIGADPGLIERLRTGLFISAANQSVDVLAMLAGAAYKAAMQPDQLYKLTYESMTTISKALEGTPATEEEMLHTERQVAHYSDMVLNKAVEIEIDRQFNPALPINRWIDKLDIVKMQTRNFIANIRPLINQGPQAVESLRQYLQALQNEEDRNPDLQRDFRQHYGLRLEQKIEELRATLAAPANAHAKLNELGELVESFQPADRVNLQGPFQNGIQRMLQAAAFNLGKGLIKEIWKASRTPYNWRGLLHHTILIPYVKGRF